MFKRSILTSLLSDLSHRAPLFFSTLPSPLPPPSTCTHMHIKNTHSPAISEHKITAFSPHLPAEEKQIVTSSAPTNPSPNPFSPSTSLRLWRRDPLLLPPPSHPLRSIAGTWQNPWAPATKYLSISCTQSLCPCLLGKREERCLGEPGSALPAPLPWGISWKGRWAEASAALGRSGLPHAQSTCSNITAQAPLTVHLHFTSSK